jgi:uncharacterized membrane protein YphA (DoxX/SURF4 family)
MSEATATTTTPTRTTSPAKSELALRVLQVLLALFFGVASALPKLIAHPSATDAFDKIGLGDWFMYFVGSLELAGAVALLIPLLCGLAGLAYIGLMIGAFVTQVAVFHGENAATPLIIMVLAGIVAWARRRNTARLVGLIRSRIQGR